MNRKQDKLAIYVPSLEGGGAERVMATIASSLAERGYSVDLLLVQKRGPYLDEISDKVNIISFNKKRMLFTLFSLRGYIAEYRPEVILSAMGHTNLATIIAAMLVTHRPRIVVSQRSARKTSVIKGPLSRAYRLMVRKLYPRADAIVAVSHGVARHLEEYYRVPSAQIRTIYNPVDLEDISKKELEAPQHRWFDGEHQVFIAVGRLAPVKDYESMLRAFALVAERHPKARLVILGAGPLHDVLLALTRSLELQDRVDLIGFQPNPYPWLARSDVYVLSSRSEGLPNSMIQAMACGLRIVSTDCEHGPAEILEDGRWGRLVPVGDVHALAAEMSQALLDVSPPNVRLRVANFNINAIIDQYAEVLRLSPTS